VDFEWDEAKRAANLRKHGVDFIDGATLFDGRPVYTYPSPRRGEERFVSVGLLADRFCAVVWTERTRIIRLVARSKGSADAPQCARRRLLSSAPLRCV